MFFEIIAVCLFALLVSWLTAQSILKSSRGNERMQEISTNIQKGAKTFLYREYYFLSFVALILSFVIYIFLDWKIALAFLIGTTLSAFCGYVGMDIATQANSRTTQAAKKNLGQPLKIAFSSGLVLGLTVVSLGLLAITLLYLAFQEASVLFGFGLGASLMAIFARVAGGIYTKAADMASDLVGKTEKNIPEDDQRNPAVIADNVGDNVGDVAGMGADLFESYVGSLIAAMALGYLTIGFEGVLLPLTIAACGVVASIIGSLSVRKTAKHLRGTLQHTLWVSSILFFFLSFIVIPTIAPFFVIRAMVVVTTGIVCGLLIGLITEYYTSASYKPTQQLENMTISGPAPTILGGLALGYQSTMLPILVIIASIGISYSTLGIFGVSLAAVGMLGILATVLAMDAYGPVADNAGGIARMAKLDKKVRARTDQLDAMGNTTAAIGKGFAVGSAALTAIALFATYAIATNMNVLNILDIKVLIGLLLGAALAFFFASMILHAVSDTAALMIKEVRRQFTSIKGLLRGRKKPDYDTCIDIATRASLRHMLLPGTLAIIFPIALGLTLGAAAVGGLIAGALITGIMLGISMANSGGAWDNAKKAIEMVNGHKNTEHKAAVIGDTVGDPLKDAAGPSLNILIKLMTLVALVFAPLFL